MQLRHSHAIWSEDWKPIEEHLGEIKAFLRKRAVVKKGGDFDRWDMEVRGGLFGGIRTLAMLEEHGAGKQLFRLRAWPQIHWPAIGLLLLLGLLAVLAACDQAWLAALPLAAGTLAIALFSRADCAEAMRALRDAIDEYTARYDSVG